jgi:L-ascorbate metabolism protein UlaG (beta-lactamase superfamily)
VTAAFSDAALRELRATLLQQLDAIRPPAGQLALWALGQSGYLVKGGDTLIAIDPYLSDALEPAGYGSNRALARLVPIVADPTALSSLAAVLCTHEHADHCDPATLRPMLAASPQARVFASYKAAAKLADTGVAQERIAIPPVGVSVPVADKLSLAAIPAAHYEQEPDALGNPAYLGFLLEFNGVRLYHSGDTVVYPGLIERLRATPIDLACLPINGRDWFREQGGLVGNLDYREAAELAAAIGARVLLPNHNDLFRGNRINPATMLDYLSTHHPFQRAHFLQVGELFYFAG